MMFSLSLATIALALLEIPQHNTVEPASRNIQISSFSTSFHNGQESRNHNIRLAASILNEKEIAPLGAFSFNQTIGPRSPKAGFMKAPYLEFGEKLELDGGGVCLVSSVLYNAALCAGMEILERYPHSSLIAYLPPGQDATVNYGEKDLRFRNPWSHPVRITSQVSGSRLVISLWSDSILLPHEICIESVRTALPDGRLRVATFRNHYRNGHLIQQELLSEDSYPPNEQLPLAGRASMPAGL